VWDEAEGLDVAFGDIAELALQCRFADCRHHGEPGCAVAAAVMDGSLPAERVAGLAKLERERARIEARRDARARADAARAGRAMQRSYREALRAKGR
jgi:ribosome biogenesis GTPase / thiamine phosphate phosphatase